MKVVQLSNYLITGSFFFIFFLVPLVWLPINFELFEFNKMILVYFLTVIILTAWILRSVVEGHLVIRRTPLDLALLLFLAANILATIFSIDPITSLFGYYGRFHGGLLSTICYIALYYALVSNFDREHIFYFLYALLFSGLLVSVYAILQHPNPLFGFFGPEQLNLIDTLRELVKNPTHTKELFSNPTFHGIDYSYWAVDVENRSFSTLGQANWLASFNAMLFFPLLCFLFLVKRTWLKIFILFLLASNYLAFTFAYSRAGLLGLIVGLATFIAFLPIYKKSLWEKTLSSFKLGKKLFLYERFKTHLTWVVVLLIVVFGINFFFGNALERRGGLKTESSQNQTAPTSGPRETALESGGVQTATIRTIVWNGSLQIFLHNPILGTGLETFGYSYYLFRPAAHNLTVEWDYLYNKAHNEYLNYLATTGIVGFLAYLFLIGFFEFLVIKFIVKSKWSTERLLAIGILAAYNSYLVQNFFGFSVVPIALLFFLFPALFFFVTNTFTGKAFVIDLAKLFPFLKQKVYKKIALVFVCFVGIIFTMNVAFMWLGDYFYNQALGGQNYEASIAAARTAVSLANYQPLYSSELAVELSGFASTSSDQAKKTSLADEAKSIIDREVRYSPNNFSILQDAKSVYFYLTKVDKGYGLDLQKASEALASKAPTDAKTQYELALVYSFLEKNNDAEKQLEKILVLKNDYQEATMQLVRIYQINNKSDKGVRLLRDWLKKNPSDQEAKNLLQQLLTG